MTIYDLRKVIAVIQWSNGLMGAMIHYEMNSEEKTFYMPYGLFVSELKAISSIESELELMDGYEISQWDALNLVIRHEYAQYTESDIMDSDIGKSIDKLTK